MTMTESDRLLMNFSSPFFTGVGIVGVWQAQTPSSQLLGLGITAAGLLIGITGRLSDGHKS
jgi:hypothetical protein